MTGKPWIQLCAYRADGSGDECPECAQGYATPAAGRIAARSLLLSRPEVTAVWVRRITDGHLRTIEMIYRDSPAGRPA